MLTVCLNLFRLWKRQKLKQKFAGRRNIIDVFFEELTRDAEDV